MNQNNENHNEWQACPPGEVGRLVDGLLNRNRALAAQRRTVAAVLLLMTAFTGYYFVGVLPNSDPNYGGIVCSRLMELAPQFLAGTLDAETSGRINVHRKHCKHCDDKLNAMSMSSASRVTRPHEATLVTAHNRDTVIQGFAALSR
jgi:hypothetical protein